MLPRGETHLVVFELGPPGSPLETNGLVAFLQLYLSEHVCKNALSLGGGVNISTCPQLKPLASCADSYSTKTAF